MFKSLDFLKKTKGEATWVSATKNIAAGGLAGGACLCFVYSLDYARTRLANDLKSTKGDGKRQYSGLIDVYKQTIATDGVMGVYRGFAISFVGIFIYRGFYFGLYDTIMPMVGSSSFAVSFAVGYAVTVVSGIASYPIDTIRRRMMMTSGGDKALMYTSSMDCAAKIMKAEGFTSFFKGAGANILRGVAGAGVLSGFDLVQDYYVKSKYGQDAYV
jgi:solute carrier family 25 (adenine nucleotide translocator) protein 4/5/6/31